MLKTFQLHCPTEDKKVTMTIEYINTTAFEDFQKKYTKGRLHTCSGSRLGCHSCKLYDTLPNKITC